ncbi:hypothetical protein GCM10017673_57540 [Streptosporangium violaceochromogenes]|nr:hypothetical protein GCM10017673_57540 [Streptosporangium violaceochromogenes]
MTSDDDAFAQAIRGAYDPTLRPLSAGPWITAATDPAAIRQCASCGADVVPRVTAWGTNWLPEWGSGLCEKAPNGVHAPTPEGQARV